MSKTHLVIGDQHAHYLHSNIRADWLSCLINDIKPDVVVNIGDAADLPSLSSYDKGKKSFQGRTYEKDIDSHLDFQSRLWSPIIARKKKLPRRVFLHGNHEYRIETATNISPELSGTVSSDDLRLNDWYDEVIPYNGNTPGTIEIDGCTYAHYFTSGVLGRPVAGEHPAYTLISKHFTSLTAGHSHAFDFCIRSKPDGTKIIGCTVGCYQDYTNDWAGEIGKQWDRGILVKRSVEGGQYDPQWISLKSIRKEYETTK